MTPKEPRSASRWLWPLAADLGCVLALAVGGRNTHDATASGWVVLAIVWPYAVAAGLAHLWLVSRRRQAGRIWPEGAIVLAVTYVLGMILRAISGRGLAPGFLVVAAIFLALTMLGWRGVVAYVTGRHATRGSR